MFFSVYLPGRVFVFFGTGLPSTSAEAFSDAEINSIPWDAREPNDAIFFSKDRRFSPNKTEPFMVLSGCKNVAPIGL